MTRVSFLPFACLVLLPALHAEYIARMPPDGPRRRVAFSGTLLPLVVAFGLTTTLVTSHAESLVATVALPFVDYDVHFLIDGLNGPLIPLLALLTFIIVLGGPKALLTHTKLRALLWLESMTLVTLTSADLGLLALGFSCALIPTYRLTLIHENDRPLLGRLFALYHLFGLSCFLTGCLVLGFYMHASGFFTMSLLRLDTSSVPAHIQSLVFALFVIAGLVRMGIAPFHSWLPASLERASLLSVSLLVSIRTGLYVLSRVAMPAFPEAALLARPLLTAVALLSAVYGALGALGQHDLRRMVGFLVVSQSGIMLTGIVFGDPHAVSGTLLYWLGFATATTGLVLMIAALSSRTGSADMRDFGGIVRRVPLLSGCFFLFGLATIAVPGTVAFVAEDMLVHGALEQHPLLTLVMIVVMVLNAITFVRAFVLTFLGESKASGGSPREVIADLLPRERIAAAMLLVALIAAGLYPQPLVALQLSAAHRIAFEP